MTYLRVLFFFLWLSLLLCLFSVMFFFTSNAFLHNFCLLLFYDVPLLNLFCSSIIFLMSLRCLPVFYCSSLIFKKLFWILWQLVDLHFLRLVMASYCVPLVMSCFPGFFMFPVVLYCLHIWRSSHPFQTLKTSQSRERPRPVGWCKDVSWVRWVVTPCLDPCWGMCEDASSGVCSGAVSACSMRVGSSGFVDAHAAGKGAWSSS